MSRKRRSWGTIKTVTRDKHVLRWTQHIPGEIERGTETFYGSYREASTRLDCIHAEVIEAERNAKETAPTIGWIYENWYLPDLRRKVANGTLKEKTCNQYTRTWEKHVKEPWENVSADDVKPYKVQEWLDDLDGNTARICMYVLKAIGDLAMRHQITSENCFRFKYEKPTRTSRKRNENTYSLAEAEKALEMLRGTDIEAPFLLNSFGGCRSGESLGVKAEEITPLESDGLLFAAVPIKRMMPNRGSEPTEDGDLKNSQSFRVALVPPPYSLQVLELASDGREWFADRGDGLPMNVTFYRLQLKSLLGEDAPTGTGLRKSWRTFAQFVWQVDFYTLEHLMGHTVKGVTGEFYLRPTTEQLAHSFAVAYANLG